MSTEVRHVQRCAFCGEEIDRTAATTLVVNIFRGDEVPMRSNTAVTAGFFIHTRCFRSALTPMIVQGSSMKGFPHD